MSFRARCPLDFWSSQGILFCNFGEGKDIFTWFFYISKPIFFRRFSLLLLNAIQASATNKCQSRLYCKSGEAKYMGMSELSEQYLNTAAIKRYTGKNIPDCQTQCLRENNCTSMNIRITADSTYKCDLLDKNLYSSRSLLVKNSSFIHLFIMVS